MTRQQQGNKTIVCQSNDLLATKQSEGMSTNNAKFGWQEKKRKIRIHCGSSSTAPGIRTVMMNWTFDASFRIHFFRPRCFASSQKDRLVPAMARCVSTGDMELLQLDFCVCYCVLAWDGSLMICKDGNRSLIIYRLLCALRPARSGRNDASNGKTTSGGQEAQRDVIRITERVCCNNIF